MDIALSAVSRRLLRHTKDEPGKFFLVASVFLPLVLAPASLSSYLPLPLALFERREFANFELDLKKGGREGEGRVGRSIIYLL